MDRGSVKDKLLLVCGSREGGAGGAAPWPPSKVFTSSELLNPDKNGLKLPPKAATTAAYYKNNYQFKFHDLVSRLKKIENTKKGSCYG